MTTIRKTSSEDPEFIGLVKLLDADLAKRDGDDNAFYAQFNKITMIRHVIVAYVDEKPVGCGAIKEFDSSAMEVKRMFLLPAYRGQGIAALMLFALEDWAKELGYARCVLETGKKQPEAIALYKKSGFKITPNYGQYIGVDNSVCFEKTL